MKHIYRVVPILLWFLSIGYLVESGIYNIEFYLENGIIRLLWFSHLVAYFMGFMAYKWFTSHSVEITRRFSASSDRGRIEGEIGTGKFMFVEYEDEERIIGYNGFFFTTLFVVFFAKYVLAEFMLYLVGIFVFRFIIKLINRFSLLRRALFLVSFAYPVSNIVFFILLVLNIFIRQPTFMDSVYDRIQSAPAYNGILPF